MMTKFPPSWVSFVMVLCVGCACLVGCGSRVSKAQAVEQQIKAVGRAAAAQAIAADVKAGAYSYDDALTMVWHQLEDVSANRAVVIGERTVPSDEITMYAGAVLDAAGHLGTALGQSDMHEPFWQRVGQLAAMAADRAMLDGRPDEARSLVLAGPQRWRTQGYWLMNPGHDALASAILAANGERDEAIRRLEERTEQMAPVVQDVYDRLRSGR